MGTTYRIRIADIAGYRSNFAGRLMRDTSVANWRAVAKDDFTLPPPRATLGPSIARVASGETADFEFTPDQAGDWRLEFGAPGAKFQIQDTVQLHVSP